MFGDWCVRARVRGQASEDACEGKGTRAPRAAACLSSILQQHLIVPGANTLLCKYLVR